MSRPLAPPVAPPLAPPLVDGRWLRPSTDVPAEPRWGHPDGLQVGIDPGPTPAPRGLLRVYAPYLDQPRERLLNFVAVEPVPVGADGRGFSELEASTLDPLPGKRMWSADGPDDAEPRDPAEPSPGCVDLVDGVEHLTVWVHVEPFDNGADVVVRVSFRADRPHEVALAVRARPGSVPLETCVLTATMGNYARLRRLHLAGRTVTVEELWPRFEGTGFAPHARFALDDLARGEDGAVVVAATTDEADPLAAAYAPKTPEHWRYAGRRAVQSWRVADPHADLLAQVNARRVYWAGTVPIPGGASYENLEVVEPFRQDRELVLAVEPDDGTCGTVRA